MLEGGEHSLRLSFARVPAEQIPEGVDRLAAALEQVRAGAPRSAGPRVSSRREKACDSRGRSIGLAMNSYPSPGRPQCNAYRPDTAYAYLRGSRQAPRSCRSARPLLLLTFAVAEVAMTDWHLAGRSCRSARNSAAVVGSDQTVRRRSPFRSTRTSLMVETRSLTSPIFPSGLVVSTPIAAHGRRRHDYRDRRFA